MTITPITMNTLKKICIVLLISTAISGCATNQEPRSRYQSRTAGDLSINKVTDAEAIDLFNSIYAQKVDLRADAAAKDITLTAFMRGLETRHSAEIRSSGITDKHYREMDLRQWTDDDLISAYDALITLVKKNEKEKAVKKYPNATSTMDSTGQRTFWSANASAEDTAEEAVITPENEEIVDPLEVIRLTAIYSIGTELSRRDTAAGNWATVGSAVGVGISVASKVASLLAMFLI